MEKDVRVVIRVVDRIDRGGLARLQSEAFVYLDDRDRFDLIGFGQRERNPIFGVLIGFRWGVGRGFVSIFAGLKQFRTQAGGDSCGGGDAQGFEVPAGEQPAALVRWLLGILRCNDRFGRRS